MYVSPAYRLRLYRNFKAIDAKDPYGIIRYYEQYEEELHTLDFDEYLDCSLSYTRALFTIDDFARHIVMCDYLIEFVMAESVTFWGGEDVFCSLLQQKGVSYYRLNNDTEALRVLHALVRIEPSNTTARTLLVAIYQRRQRPIRMKFRAIGLLLFLSAAFAAGVSGLIIQPFFEEWHPLAVKVSVGLFILGACTYLWAEYRHDRWSQYKAKG